MHIKNAKGKNVQNWIPAFAGMTGRVGSALILTVVLTSLLAIIGIMFVMAANMDKLTTSSISINKELNFAVDSVIAQISQRLVEDVPGVAGQEYYDYPDGSIDPWLANVEPDSSNNWQHISDLYVEWSGPGLTPVIIPEHKAILLDNNGRIDRTNDEDRADADGDGVADSRWTELRASFNIPNTPVITKSGKRVYAAIRIVDNGGMLNINTARQFDANSTTENEVDGSSQIQINLLSLTDRGSTSNPLDKLDSARFGFEPHILNNYIDNVVWRYYRPDGRYTPFDIGDELELRNRFLINLGDIDCRIESIWTNAFKNLNLRTPVPWDNSAAVRQASLQDWFYRAQHDVPGPNDIYSYRHLATTYNFDRIMNPAGGIMASLRPDNTDGTYSNDKADSIFNSLNDAIGDEAEAGQITANLIDYCDSDSDVTEYTPPSPAIGGPYYGFERPCIYISELAYKYATWQDSANQTVTARSYAIELYKPYPEDIDPNNVQRWQLRIGSQDEPINNWTAGSQYHVMIFENPAITNNDNCTQKTIASDVTGSNETGLYVDIQNQVVELQREAPAGSNNYITVDSVQFTTSPLPQDDDCLSHSIERNIDLHKCIRHLWRQTFKTATLGSVNGNHVDPDNRFMQAHPANRPLTNVGEIGMIFRKSAYPHAGVSDFITNTDTEADARVNLAVNPYQRIFEHLTVFDPNSDTINNDGDNWTDETELDRTLESKIVGRININTAPWYVIAQLPWVSDHSSNHELARAIVAYRDRLNLTSSGGPDYSTRPGNSGFENIGELNLVAGGPDDYRIDYYATAASTGDLTQFPDLTTNGGTGDGAPDDFEERDVIFARISNLVTVRSDVFTAYILVRLGPDGPQKRVIAILDRSDVYPNPGGGAIGKVKIVALWPVPDSR